VRGDGQITGSVSGGCIEDDLIAKVRAGALDLQVPQVLRYGVGAEEAARFGLPCGGTMELVFEPVAAHTRVDELLERLSRGERVRRVLALASGEVQLLTPQGSDELRLDADTLVTTHGPSYRLLLIGAGQLTQYLADMARALDYEVIVCDPRTEYADTWAVPGARLVRTMPDDTLTALKPDGHTAVIALTHDPKLDDLALLEALQSPAFYVGAIGSRINQARRKARLKEHFGLDDRQLNRLHGPVGIRNGARTPPEIAVSILAELTAVRYGHAISAAPPAGAAPGLVGCVV
jgi:xanthine dehydrogenase accessory factor